MRNKNAEYKKVQIGDMLLLIPTKRDNEYFVPLPNEILWSLKEFDYKVFGYLHPDFVLTEIIKSRAKSGEDFYNIVIDLYNADSYPDDIEKRFRNRWAYVVMRQAYRYFDQLTKNYPDLSLSALATHCAWNNNTQDLLEICPLDEAYQIPTGVERLAIQFSSYTTYSEEEIENLLVCIGKCEKLKKDYKDFAPSKDENPEITVSKEHMIKKWNDFFMVRKDKIYCGLEDINPNILFESNWRHFTSEMIRGKGCSDCNLGYIMEVCLPKERHLDVFTHTLIKEYGSGGNDCYSVYLQILKIVAKHWEELKKTHPDLAKIILQTRFDEKRSKDEMRYIQIHYLNKKWKEIAYKEIPYTEDGDYKITNREAIEKAL